MCSEVDKNLIMWYYGDSKENYIERGYYMVEVNEHTLKYNGEVIKNAKEFRDIYNTWSDEIDDSICEITFNGETIDWNHELMAILDRYFWRGEDILYGDEDFELVQLTIPVENNQTETTHTYDEETLNQISHTQGKEEPDMVNHPNHYTPEGGRETLDYMEYLAGTEALIIHCTLNAVKYRDRAYKKENPKQDYAKAEFYMDYATELKKKINAMEAIEGILKF